MSGALVVAALSVWAFGALVHLAWGSRCARARAFPFVAGLVGGGLAAAAGVLAVYHPQGTVFIGVSFRVGRTSVHLDSLAGLFLSFTGCLAVALSACLVGWVLPEGRLHITIKRYRFQTACGFGLVFGAKDVGSV